MYSYKHILLIKTKTNNNQSKQNENKNNYMHNFIKTQQIKLLLQVDNI